MRLIDADELKKKSYKHTMISQNQADYGFEYEWDCVDTEDLDESPTIDAEPVRHGHWVENHYEFYVLNENYKPVLLNGINYKCNICNKDNEKTTDYCPNCGAKMDEVSE